MRPGRVLLQARPDETLRRLDQDNRWESAGSESCFSLLAPRGPLPGGWVRLELELETPAAVGRPRLVTQEVGASEGVSIPLPRPERGVIRAVVRLPRAVHALRLQPRDEAGTLRLGRIAVREIPSIEAGLRLVLPLARELLREPRRIAPAVRKLFAAFLQGGLRGVKHRVVERTRRGRGHVSYAEWIEEFDTLGEADLAAIRRRIEALPRRPLLSVLMPVHDPPLQYLRLAIDSVRRQLYPGWELCIADDASQSPGVRQALAEAAAQDPRIRVVFRERNGHISEASNSALDLARGEYVLLLDHDDELAAHALYLMAEEIVAHPEADVVYSDEDKLDPQGQRYDPLFKPEFSPDLFTAQNYVSHLGAYRADLVRRLGGFRKGFEGSQDYDLCLRCLAESARQRIRHVPHVLYHWRAIAGSTAARPEAKRYAEQAARRALQEFLDRTEPGAVAEIGEIPTTYRIRRPLLDPQPLVSLIVPTRDGYRILKQSVDSLEKTTYRSRELIVVDNQSRDPDTVRYLDELQDRGAARVLRYDLPFNYAALNNFAVRKARGALVCLLNNDIEVISPDWLSEMVAHALRPAVGAVGAKLRYPDGSLQHAGVIAGLGGVAGHSHKALPADAPGYFWRVHLTQNVSAVTAACLVVRRALYLEMGGLDEKLAVAFNDVDFCLRLREAGYLNVWTPYAELYHHESKTRGIEDTADKQARFRGEIAYMKERWGPGLLDDPYYSPNLTLDSEDFALAWPPRAPKPWRQS